MNYNFNFLITLLISLALSLNIQGQDKLSIQGRDGKMHTQWREKWTAIRLGLGAQGHFFTELGATRISTTYRDSSNNMVSILQHRQITMELFCE